MEKDQVAREERKLPALQVRIYDGEECVGVEELPDPREGFIAAYNRAADALGLRAVACSAGFFGYLLGQL